MTSHRAALPPAVLISQPLPYPPTPPGKAAHSLLAKLPPHQPINLTRPKVHILGTAITEQDLMQGYSRHTGGDLATLTNTSSTAPSAMQAEGE